jgi:hypothetical protein
VYSVDFQKVIHVMHVEGMNAFIRKTSCRNLKGVTVVDKSLARLGPDGIWDRESFPLFADDFNRMFDHIGRTFRKIAIVVYVYLAGVMFHNMTKDRHRGHLVPCEFRRSPQNFHARI